MSCTLLTTTTKHRTNVHMYCRSCVRMRIHLRRKPHSWHRSLKAQCAFVVGVRQSCRRASQRPAPSLRRGIESPAHKTATPEVIAHSLISASNSLRGRCAARKPCARRLHASNAPFSATRRRRRIFASPIFARASAAPGKSVLSGCSRSALLR